MQKQSALTVPGAASSGWIKPLLRAGMVVCALAILTPLLSGCVEQVADLQASSAVALPTPSTIVRRADVSPRGAVVALASIDGPPDAVVTRFAQALVAQAATRDIVLGDVAKARYLVRGYVTAYAVEGGTAFGYVWDIFETGKARAQRLTDAVVIKETNATDAWSLATDAMLTGLAAKSTEELAAFLSNTPEAIAAAGVSSARVAAKPMATKPLGYAADQ